MLALLAIQSYGFEVAERFFNGLAVSELGDFERGDPRRSLVEYAINYKMRSKQSLPYVLQANLIAKAFLAFAQGRKVYTLKWDERETTVHIAPKGKQEANNG